jgi:hypothetical protein
MSNKFINHMIGLENEAGLCAGYQALGFER